MIKYKKHPAGCLGRGRRSGKMRVVAGVDSKGEVHCMTPATVSGRRKAELHRRASTAAQREELRIDPPTLSVINLS